MHLFSQSLIICLVAVAHEGFLSNKMTSVLISQSKTSYKLVNISVKAIKYAILKWDSNYNVKI